MNSKILIRFGKNLKRYRLEAGLTQEELAERTNLHQTTIAKLELGQMNPSLKNMYIITRALSIRLTNILDFD